MDLPIDEVFCNMAVDSHWEYLSRCEIGIGIQVGGMSFEEQRDCGLGEHVIGPPGN